MWALAKRFVRERVSGSIVVLRGLVRRAITGIDKLYLQRVWQKMWRYIDLYDENVSGPDAAANEKRTSALRAVQEGRRAAEATKRGPDALLESLGTVKKQHRGFSKRLDEELEACTFEYADELLQQVDIVVEYIDNDCTVVVNSVASQEELEREDQEVVEEAELAEAGAAVLSDVDEEEVDETSDTGPDCREWDEWGPAVS